MLEWSTTPPGGARVTQWRSRDLGPIQPAVELRPITGAPGPDLFWTIDFEQSVGAMLVSPLGTGARVAFTSPDQGACRTPVLRDVTGEGRPDIVVYEVGALSLDECRGDALASICSDAYLTEWARVYVQVPGGRFVAAPDQARAFYATLADQYARDAQSLRSAIAAHTGPAAASPRCDASLADQLDRLGRRAREIANRG